MYGDERHSSVLLNEIDGFKLKYEQLKSFMSRGYSRTEYGRSARGSRRQPRPQIFKDDDDDASPSTIFRVVTETSIKVGEAVTKPMTSELLSATYKSATADYDPSTAEYTSQSTTVPAFSSSASEQTTRTTETMMETTYTNTAETTTTEEPTTTETTVKSTTNAIPELPVAMERIGYEDIDDYDYDPARKSDTPVLQNSVEEKIKHKENPHEIKRNEPIQYEDTSIYEVLADDATEEPASRTTEPKKVDDEPAEEEIPRRGM